MQTQIAKWGNSLGIRIPKWMAEKAGLAEGIPVVLEVEQDAIIIRKKVYALETLLSRVTPSNLHTETETGRPVGKETW
ncbi:MAG: AbrB/MazE/SpoVT family DNA-binding domain-containing protein [Pelotomaculaceae bacterium]|jgi:antitoxin MazE|nr:AbrB/MazE/SpoVT family DNA-binding domain-containing protein [Bacillota bacterium]HHU86816.1 AbrB/MazE/SpoVT family DNA-binding domain-containing protein [Peptococcaceae bacterium]